MQSENKNKNKSEKQSKKSSKKQSREVNGMVIIDKPVGSSSNQILQKVKYLFQAKKAGHTGSLDPLASGVLPICFGEATKFSQYLLNADKIYIACLKFGQTTTTADAEGELLKERPVHVTLEQLNKVLAGFVGEQMQTPSMFSAIKHQGQPLYKLAREGIEIERQARVIHIYELKLRSVFPSAQTGDDAQVIRACEIRVHCSKGTYIRNLAEDIGEKLGCGAHLTDLRRIQAGGFTQMITLDELIIQVNDDSDFHKRDACLLPVEAALLHFPEFSLVSEQVLALKQGKKLSVSELTRDKGYVRLLDVSKKQGKESCFMGLGFIDTVGVLSPQRLMKTN